MLCFRSNPHTLFLLSLFYLFLLRHEVVSDALHIQTSYIPGYHKSFVFGGRQHSEVLPWKKIERRNLAEGNGGENNSSLILAENRTHRKDPLNDFKKYTGGWNISNQHYWASVVLTAAPFFGIAAAWFVLFALCLFILCIRHCCCRLDSYGYSRIAYALSLIFLILFTIAAIVGCVVLYTGQGKFHASTTNTLNYVVHKADVTAENLRNVSGYLSAAKKINVDSTILSPDMQKSIDDVDKKINSSASTLSTKAADNKDNIQHGLDRAPLTCKKGSECEYRHSEYARINPRDCYYWLNGNCMNQKCGFRHPPLEGLLGSQVAAPSGSSVLSSHNAAIPAPASYNQGVSYNPRTQAVPCVFFQKGLCLKGDWCTFLHGPSTSNKATQPAASITATEPISFKKSFGAAESSQLKKFPPTNVSKTVGVPPEGRPAPKVEAASARSGTAINRSVPHPAGMDEELPQHKATYTTSVVNSSTMIRSNCLHQLHVSNEPGFHAGKETDEFLRESSPGFDVLVDDEHGGSDFYRGEDRYRGARGPEGRNVNEYDIGHAANYDAMVDIDREMFHEAHGHDLFDHVQGNYGWDQLRASPEMISMGPSSLERRGYPRAHSPDLVEESDLRHRLSKHKRVNGLRSVVSQDHALENHEGERNYSGSLRDSHPLPPHESSLSSRLQGRIKLPGRSVVNGTDPRSEREIGRGRNWGRLSPGKPQTTSLHGRLRDRIKGRVEGEYSNKDGRKFGGSRIRREIMDGRNAVFAGPKSLAELKVCKNTDNNERLSLGKRKSIEIRQQTEGGISFEGPKPLSEILKRKRQSEPAVSGSGIEAVHKKDVNPKQSKPNLNGSSTNTVVSLTPEEANGKEGSKSASADTGIVEVAPGESSQLNTREHETEKVINRDVTMENDEHEADNQGGGDYYYEQGDEGEYNYEEVETVDPEEEYIEEEDGEDADDFEKKLGVMFS